MKIAISATGPSLESEIDPRFGRSAYFIIVDPETMQFETLTNPGQGISTGAGISTAQLICNKGALAVITGAIGPKAHQVLSAAGVRMLTGVSGRINKAIEKFKSGKLDDWQDAGVPQGMPSGPGMGSGMGRISGMGMGRGMGVGRGTGRGMGCGGGKGMGMGVGGGRGPRRGFPGGLNYEPLPVGADELNNRDEIALLKQQAEALSKELVNIKQRIEQMEKK